ncbi:MAG: AI-2E family transporter, partial [Terracidiphilus sp.]
MVTLRSVAILSCEALLTNPELASRRWMGTFLSYGVVVLIAYLAFRIFEPFFVALAWAAVLVVVSYRAYEWLVQRMRPSLAALTSTFGVTVILIAPAVLILIVFLRQGAQALESLHLGGATTGHVPFVHDIWIHLQARFPELNSTQVTAEVHRYGEQAAQFLAERLGTAVRHTAEFVFDLFIT